MRLYDEEEGDLNFTELLRDYVIASMMENPEIYKRAGLSRAVFSSLFTRGHIPKKRTILALAIGLKLDLHETERLLMKAGYSFSDTIKGDLIVARFITQGIYDINRINEALYEQGEPLLGSRSY